MPESSASKLRALLDRALVAGRSARRDTKLIVLTTGLLVLSTAIIVPFRPSDAWLVGLYASLFAALYASVLRRLELDWGTVAILLGAFGLYLAYLSYTSYGERNYDADEQLRYVRFIVKKRALPAAAECYVCHHPPAYYVLAAGPYAFFAKTKLASPAFGLQLFSLAIFLAFVVASVLLVRRYTRDPWRIRLAAALVAFWPYSVHNAVRVHNDTLLATLVVVALVFVVRWQQEDRDRDLYAAAGVSALALLTKSSGYVVVVPLALLLAHRLGTRPDRWRRLARAAAVVGVLAGAMLVNTWRKGEQVPDAQSTGSLVDRRGALCQKLLGSACDHSPTAWVDNRPFNYVWFDLESFLSEPYLLADRDETGRHFFWNHLVQSSLFGTHNKVADRETAYAMNRTVAELMHPLLVGMMGVLAIAFAGLERARLRRYAVPFTTLVVSIAFAMAFRALVPVPHHSDFRHIFPVTSLLALAYASAVGASFERRGLLGPIGVALAVPFLALSTFYFWPKHAWAERVTAHTVRVPLAEVATVAQIGRPWDARENRIFEGNDTLELVPKRAVELAELDVSFDHNDVYEVRIEGSGEPKRLELGPTSTKRGGLVRYRERFDPPIAGVRRVTVRAVRGDRAYAMGHLVLRPPPASTTPPSEESTP